MLLSGTSKYTRWVVLTVFCLLSASNGFQFINYAPIFHECRDYFGMSVLQVNFLTTIYTIVYPALIFLGCVSVQQHGPHGAMLLGALTNAIGAIIKTVGALYIPSFGILLLSQSFNGLSEVFFLSLPPVLAATWFNSRQRTLACSIAVISNSVGTAVGFIIPPLVINESHHSKESFTLLFGVQAVVSIAIVLFILLLPPRPENRPSITAAQTTSLKDVLPTLKYLMTHPSYLCLGFASGFCGDSLWVFASLLSQALPPFGVSEVQCGWIGFSLTMSGIVSASIIGAIVDKTRKYKSTLLGLSFGALASFSALLLSLMYGERAKMFALSFTFVTIMGFFLSATVPLQLEFAVELTYPHPEGVSTTFLLCLSGILSPILTVIATNMLGESPLPRDIFSLLVLVISLTTVSAVLMLLVRDNLHRVIIEAAVPYTKHPSCLPSKEAVVKQYGSLTSDGATD